MNQCQFDDSNTCPRCGFVAPPMLRNPLRNCPGPPCEHLGHAVVRDGVAIRVKCNCPKSSGTKEVYHDAHKCDVFHRCLPGATMTPSQLTEWNERHESFWYALCSLCPLKDCNYGKDKVK